LIPVKYIFDQDTKQEKDTGSIKLFQSNISSKTRTSCCKGDDVTSTSPVPEFAKELCEIAGTKSKAGPPSFDCVGDHIAAERVATFAAAIAATFAAVFAVTIVAEISTDVQRLSSRGMMLVNKGALSNARSNSSEGVILANEGDQVFFWSTLASASDGEAVPACKRSVHGVCSRNRDDEAARIRDGYYKAEVVRAVPARDSDCDAVYAQGSNEEAARARDDDCSGMHGRDGRSKAARVRDGCYEAARGRGSDTEFVRAVHACVVPARAQDGNEEAARATSDDSAHIKRNKEAARARGATTEPPTTNPTTHPTGLPANAKNAKALDVPVISSKMKLPSFAREYENITSLFDTTLEKDRIFTKLGVALFLRTKHCYKFRKLRELPEHVMLNSGIREFT
jgi:hypothetical protein